KANSREFFSSRDPSRIAAFSFLTKKDSSPEGILTADAMLRAAPTFRGPRWPQITSRSLRVKSGWELIRGLLIFRMCSFPTLTIYIRSRRGTLSVSWRKESESTFRVHGSPFCRRFADPKR
uniref:Uncharacterized protein n=1 Tax=Callorhinchus milii TaxID=7868 RepID=A0A4W3GIG6_CALMI